MDCIKFQDSVSDYLDGELDSRGRAECATHRLVCRDCRELYNDVRATVQALNGIALQDALGLAEGLPEGLADRIIAATTTGEMLSCNEFDKLLERYFDGVILAPTFQNFQSHFEQCPKCRRLLAGIEDVVAMCRDAKDVEVEVPDSLHDRIVAATVGAKSANWRVQMQNRIFHFALLFWTPQMAAAALIFAASTLLVISRWGGVEGMAEHAETKAKRIVSESTQRINTTGARARAGFQNVSYGVNTLLFDDDGAGAAPTRSTPNESRGSSPTPAPQRSNAPRDERNP